MKRKRAEILKATRASTPLPQAIKEDEAEWISRDFNEILNQDVAVAVPLLRQLIGPITIDQVHEPGKSRPTWIARFTINLVEIAARLEKNHCPTSGVWELLNTRGWTMLVEVDLRLEARRPSYEVLASEVVRLHARCKSIPALVAVMKRNERTLRAALIFGTTGQRPKSRVQKKYRCRSTSAGKKEPKIPLYVLHATTVAHLRDDLKWSFARIALHLKISEKTVRQAYDHIHPENAKEAIDHGTHIQRGRYSYLGPEVYDRIQEYATTTSKTNLEIAELVGCSAHTVRRIRKAAVDRKVG